MLLHGFPDNNRTMDGLILSLADAGWYAVAPVLPGYVGSAPPDGQDYGLASLARWADATAEHLFSGKHRPVLLGHDWGGVISFVAAAMFPARWGGIVSLSVPPPLHLLRRLVDHPAQLVRSSYMAFFQVPNVPEWVLAAEPLQVVSRLWRTWSPGWDPPMDHVAQVAADLAILEVAKAALAYYRHLIVRSPSDWPRFRRDWLAARTQIVTPALVITGDNDRCIAPACFDRLNDSLKAPFELKRIRRAGHFVHLEAHNEVMGALLDFLNTLDRELVKKS